MTGCGLLIEDCFSLHNRYIFICSWTSKYIQVFLRIVFFLFRKAKSQQLKIRIHSICVFLLLYKYMLCVVGTITALSFVFVKPFVHGVKIHYILVCLFKTGCYHHTILFANVFLFPLIAAHSCQDFPPSFRATALRPSMCHNSNILRPYQRLKWSVCCVCKLQMLDVFHTALCGVSCAVQLE